MLWLLLAYVKGAVDVTKLDTKRRREHTEFWSIGLSEALFTKK